MATFSDRVFQRLQRGLNQVQERVVQFEREGGFAAMGERIAEKIEQQERKISAGRHPLNPDYHQQVRLWYARLELPYGSGEDQIRKSFRNLMRKYHPDRFTGNRESELLANQLSQELTVAYEGLLEFVRTRK